ncbi:hypothetical protein SAMD00023353_5100400 [Rosellinia necatrix]|uniref:Uncharacterized protein n=1 Tax=Rosellinia necatrix TaxID=77044 RepID=A0A1W2TR19_ROSNE|nr:hypothetical protein SAMD00023353_5100400 [Rosellinia necatrix]
MKLVSNISDRLSEARREIENLKEENARLRKENAQLRAAAGIKTKSPTTTSTGGSSLAIARYAQPTESSRRKTAPSPQQPKKNTTRIPGIVSISGSDFVYKDGVPTLVDKNKFPIFRPSFAKRTVAADQREFAVLAERVERRKRVDLRRLCPAGRPLPTPPYEEYPPFEWVIPRSPESEMQLEPFFDPDLEFGSESDSEDGEAAEETLETRTRLEGVIDFGPDFVYVDTKKTFDWLREAATIVQRVIFDAVQRDEEWRPMMWCFRGGPHLVRLGRNEMLGWLSRVHSSKLARPANADGSNGRGYSTRDIESSLLKLVDLRNVISHPTACELLDCREVDWLLYYAQRVAVYLDDAPRAAELRAIRDALLELAEQSLQDIRDLSYLAVQPDCEHVQFSYHQEKQFRAVLEVCRSGGGKNYMPEIIAVAEA